MFMSLYLTGEYGFYVESTVKVITRKLNEFQSLNAVFIYIVLSPRNGIWHKKKGESFVIYIIYIHIYF